MVIVFVHANVIASMRSRVDSFSQVRKRVERGKGGGGGGGGNCHPPLLKVGV